MITIFTATYNRAYILEKLFKSLQNQTNQSFEWLIIDDGSIDKTELLVKSFINMSDFPIRYYKQQNGGKHRAINRGLQLASGEYFFIVDSDDYLKPNALETVEQFLSTIKDDEFAGVVGLKVFPNNQTTGGEVNYETLDTDMLSYRVKYNYKGDKAEIFKTEILRQFPFPEFEDEKFCTEALVWNRIAQKYKMRYFNKKVYVCEYLQDGLSASSIKSRKNSHQATLLYYYEYSRYKIPFAEKCKAIINYWRFALLSKKLVAQKPNVILSCILFPITLLMYIKDYRQ